MANASEHQEHVLQHQWSFFLHYPTFNLNTRNYSSQAYDKLGDVSTVEAFWRYFEHIPMPSNVFATMDASSRVSRPKVDGRILEAIGLFKTGPRPEWEDPLNLKGGHWECRKEMPLHILDQLWKDLCLALVGELLEKGRDIVGARVVDKSKSRKVEYRLEVWIATTHEDVVNEVLGNLQNALREHDQNLHFVWKNHGDTLHTALECNKAELGL